MAYDKEKAHEYYINYVKKGLKKGRGKKSAQEQAESDRKSTKGLNDAGKAAAKRIKEQIMQQRKLAYQAIKDELNTKVAELRERIKEAKAAAKKPLDLDNPDSFPEDINSLQAEIERLREVSKQKKEKVKNYFNERYYQMLDELKGDSDFKAVKKSKKKKGSK